MHRRLCHEQSRDVRVSALTIRLPSHAIHTIGVNAREQRRDPIIHHTGRSKNALIFPQPAASCYPDSMPLTDTYPYSSASTFSQTVVTWNPLIGGSALSYEDPFGAIISLSGDAADDNPFRFSTKYHEATDVGTSGDTPRLVYYGYRFYDPEFGRWLSRDPIGERGGLNLYRFCGNRPLSVLDAVGLYDVVFPLFYPKHKADAYMATFFSLHKTISDANSAIREVIAEIARQPDDCAWKQPALEEITFAREVLMGIQQGLNSNDRLYMNQSIIGWAHSPEGNYYVQDLFGRHYIGVAVPSDANALLHELSHMYGTEDPVPRGSTYDEWPEALHNAYIFQEIADNPLGALRSGIDEIKSKYPDSDCCE